MTPDSEYDPDELLSAAKWSRLIQCLEHAPIFSLTLGTGRMPYAGLVRLLSSLRSRLRWLTISNARLVDTEENDVLIWPRAFHWIAHNLELEYVEFYDLSHDETEMATLDDDNKFVARGTPDVVRTLLEHFIKTVKFYDDDAGLLRDERGWLSVAEEEGLGNIPPQHTDADDEEIYGDSFDESDVQLMDDLASPR
ncbi:hypothetical protein B0A48_00998 [Cryoendolithus antarcticus]|uniref:Uncharacterized protein n=1 Tax=Cryoendolithus antarcticus TaxID=1507870 RepID=A0A1V8TSE8_9PEZI|nr:hypothetical protein B0A48_00998 [Cryoendolithus antarcticus]